MSIQPNLDRIIAHLTDLPAMPAIVAEVLQKTEDPSVPMSELSELIQRDPALTVKILRVSNSPYYGMRQYVSTLKLALVILGVREVRNIVVGISVLGTIGNDRTKALLSNDFWDHAVTTAGLSRKLGAAMALSLQGEDFIAGLLHDVGRMVLCRCLGDEYSGVYTTSLESPENLFSLENAIFGFNHADAAAALAMRWNLPVSLRDALYCHHPHSDRRLDQAKDPRLAAVVRIANMAARFDFAHDDGELCPACQDEDAWAILANVPKPIPASSRFEVLSGFSQELESTPKLSFL